MAGPFARQGARTRTTQPTPGVTVTETEPGGFALQNNAASWVLVWGLILVFIGMVSGTGKAFFGAFVHPNQSAANYTDSSAELFLGLLFVGLLTLVSALSAEAAIIALTFEGAISLMVVFNTMDLWPGVLNRLTSSAAKNHKPAPTDKKATK